MVYSEKKREVLNFRSVVKLTETIAIGPARLTVKKPKHGLAELDLCSTIPSMDI